MKGAVGGAMEMISRVRGTMNDAQANNWMSHHSFEIRQIMNGECA